MYRGENRMPVLWMLSLLSAWIFSCTKQDFLTDKNATLVFTADTLRFDTVFSSVGSVTRYFTLINSNRQKLRIEKIKLMGGAESAYRMNVDGTASPELSNIELDAGDSVYVFVSVTIDPTSHENPFLVQDSIEVTFNGNQRFIHLEAFGQNARFLHNYLVEKDTIWTNDLPYVISGGLQIAEGHTLTIAQGCRIYLHADAPVIVDGTLRVEGTKDNPVIFRGDRLETDYRDLPASWPGIFFRANSVNNVIRYGVIKNAYQGVIAAAPADNGQPKLLLSECRIDNVYDAGILAIGSGIEVVNCLISNCGSNVVIQEGGDYRFTYCTIVSYNNNYINHKNPVVLLSNAGDTGDGYDLNALFRNCILWGEGGNVENEVHAERREGAVFDINFDHVLYKAKELPSDIQVINSIANQDPLFDSIHVGRHYFDFHIGKNASPAIGAGVVVPVAIDLDGRSRTGDPDLGAYTKD